jgi:hypothetical protein
MVSLLFSISLGVGIGSQLSMIGKTYLPQFAGWKHGIYFKKYPNPMQKYIALKNYLQRGDIVLSDVFTSWVLPCITDVKVISLFHNSPLILQNFERLHDTMTFFTSPNDRAKNYGKIPCFPCDD